MGNKKMNSTRPNNYDPNDFQDYNHLDSSAWQGAHAGKGPKGFKRSDERIKEAVCETLERHPEIDATDIEVAVKDACVTLTGTVESSQIKRLAEDSIENLPGISEVQNDLRVMTSSENPKKTDSNSNYLKSAKAPPEARMAPPKATASSSGKAIQ